MNRFAALLDRLALESGDEAKIRLMADYFRDTPDPERGFALAALTGALAFTPRKPPRSRSALLRALILERADPELFALSHAYVRDLAETAALMWPRPEGAAIRPPLLSEILEGLADLAADELPGRLADWLDGLDETGRWALLRLVTGALKPALSARLAKAAVARLGPVAIADLEPAWRALAPPYLDLFAWVEGRGPRPAGSPLAPFLPPQLAHAATAADLAGLTPEDYRAEWKWDGLRVQLVAAEGPNGDTINRLYARSGEDLSALFPDLAGLLPTPATLDGELLVVQDGRAQPFALLQRRLGRKRVTPKLRAECPARIRAYDLLTEGAEDLRALPFTTRRTRLEALIGRLGDPRLGLSPLIPFSDWDALAAAHAAPATHGAGADAAAVEGVMVKRADSPYVAGRPKGLWWKWKRDPHGIDAVLMYAQRGRGPTAAYYSDCTFGVWTTTAEGLALVPVGKADIAHDAPALPIIDAFVRQATLNRFGPVREVAHDADMGLVAELAFEAVERSARHRAGLTLRALRLTRLRTDKQPHEADRLESLEKLLPPG